jgi:hypothetical protein
MNIRRVAPGRVDRKTTRRRDDFRNAVHHVAPEEKQLAPSEFDGLPTIHNEYAPA